MGDAAITAGLLALAIGLVELLKIMAKKKWKERNGDKEPDSAPVVRAIHDLGSSIGVTRGGHILEETTKINRHTSAIREVLGDHSKEHATLIESHRHLSEAQAEMTRAISALSTSAEETNRTASRVEGHVLAMMRRED